MGRGIRAVSEIHEAQKIRMTKPAPPEKPPRLTRHELGRYIVADLIDHLGETECTIRSLKKQAENALAALNNEKREGE